MKKIFTIKRLMVLTVLAFTGIGTYAFADWGMGPGMMGERGHHGPGWHHGGWNNSGYGHMAGNLSDDELVQMNKKRSEFIEATENLRQDLYAKQLELISELAKNNPDFKRTSNLQNDISDLQARLDQKRIDHMIEMRKINPGTGREFMVRGGMGYGPGSGGYCRR